MLITCKYLLNLWYFYRNFTIHPYYVVYLLQIKFICIFELTFIFSYFLAIMTNGHYLLVFIFF